MKSLDAFGRPVKEFQVKTTLGGYLSVCSFCAIAILFLTELRYFLKLEAKDELLIDQNQDTKYLNITLDITFPYAPCSVIQMNLIDPKKANVMHVVHEIFKKRLDNKGKQIGRTIRDSLVNVAQTSQELSDAASEEGGGERVKTTHATPHLRCASCFQSHIDEDDCCSSCQEVREAFKQKGWGLPKDYVFGQCINEAYAESPSQHHEGCQVQAMLHVRKVAATIHIGVGRHLNKPLIPNSHQLSSLINELDFSHNITKLRFGVAFPGFVPVLDGRTKSSHKSGTSEHYQYDVHVIPTRYVEEGSEEIASHQYSVTEYVKSIDQKQRHQELVALGLWANYDFTPFEVKVTKARKPFSHFFTECCAILGGIFAFTGMLDNFAYQINKSLAKKSARNLGGTQLTSMGPSD